jgi:hypothetical protein
MRVYVCVCVYKCIYKYADLYKFIQDPDPDPGSDPELSEKSDPDAGSDPKSFRIHNTGKMVFCSWILVKTKRSSAMLSKRTSPSSC